MSAALMPSQPTLPSQSSNGNEYINANALRNTFSLAMSAMYKAEVPLYGDLVRIVNNANEEIRSRTSQELRTVRRIFAILGMRPVGYYDLAVAGLPMHATCFRPIDTVALEANPFRMFTTLLRPGLLASREAHELAMRLLNRRNIFSDTLLDLVDTTEMRQGGRLKHEQGDLFIREATRSFSWQPIAAATHEEYEVLRTEHPILADIACFNSAHINHLTPRALDIGVAQAAMIKGGLSVKDRIEGPPLRKCPILLRQTSFLALEEHIRFPCAGSRDQCRLVDGQHKARFGEIEERGAAVTPKGRKLYDELLEEAMSLAQAAESHSAATLDKMLARTFERYPDDWDELRRQRLIYCEYQCDAGAKEKLVALGGSSEATPAFLDKLVVGKILKARPITYEDFLPFSAAGIFQSNLQAAGKKVIASVGPGSAGREERDMYEAAMGCPALDADQLYAEAQRRSLEECANELELGLDDVSALLQAAA
ncbi:hypothetical protein UCDDA912_g04493 [Diaporthe ampelina]|uniref:2-oxoadipate dioxygenase/decarboxylase n=1 Tax=Diaporthe ampelina TaxID=1214573 RepID=A0A0G2FME8_9PEZI|nr:hypothetical protein UCDDA912_g04493 [Diaporthe ampelina]